MTGQIAGRSRALKMHSLGHGGPESTSNVGIAIAIIILAILLALLLGRGLFTESRGHTGPSTSGVPTSGAGV